VCRVLSSLPDPPAKAPLVPARIAWIEDGREVDYVFRDEGGNAVMVPAYDPALEDWMTRHEHPEVPEDRMRKHDIYATDQATFAAGFAASLKKELEEATHTLYTERDQVKEDAMQCFNEHHRPTDGCMDVFSEAKLLGGHESNRRMPMDQRMYLCHACPFVHGYVIPDVRHKKGYYDENYVRPTQPMRGPRRRRR
jgi:hypothetical protein